MRAELSTPNDNDMKSLRTLAAEFANGATKGRAGNVFIEGDKIYSYGHHFIIAERRTERAYYFNTRKYSQSTSRQQSRVRMALLVASRTIFEKSI